MPSGLPGPPEINLAPSSIPILIKLSPDFENKNIEKMCELLLKESVNGIILTNTSVLNREKLINKNRQELGGLSGFPIFKISNDKIKIFYKFIGKKMTKKFEKEVSDFARKKYIKKHQNKNIEDYGFTKKQILSDFDFVYQEYFI